MGKHYRSIIYNLIILLHNMDIVFAIIFLIIFFGITWRKIEYGIALFLALLPTYLIRFHIGPIPTTLLELMFGIVTIVWLSKYFNSTLRVTRYALHKNKLLITGIILFLLAATVSIFTAADVRAAAGEWKAFYVEPIIFFFILISVFSHKKSTDYTLHVTRYIVFPLILCGLITALFAIYQHFTGFFVPHAFWANNDSYRVTAWYGFPNAVGLFLAPLIPLSLFFWSKQNRVTGYGLRVTSVFFVIVALIAIFFSKSTGALIGILAGLGLLLLLHKKMRIPTIIICLIGIIAIISVPNLSSIKSEIFFQDRSGQIRMAIYDETWEFLKDNPIFGAGLASYDEKIAPYHQKVNGQGVEIYHHPHNIFLTIWVNTGLLGLVGFMLIVVGFYQNACSKLPVTRYWLLVTAASFTTLLVSGLVDSPYIKNDLAMLFWTIVALIGISRQQRLAANIQ